MQTNSESLSRVMPIGVGYCNGRCGYCKSKSSSFAYYANAFSLTPAFYQSLLDRGWRRSGITLYKPDLRASCCPHYTIRLDSHQFNPTKDQRQKQNRFTSYVLGDSFTKEAARLYPPSRGQAKKRKNEFDLLERVHESEMSQLKTPPAPAHVFEVTIESNTFTEEKYAIFENYQRKVHREPPSRISKGGFKSFLCDSPLQKSGETAGSSSRLQGSYHQCYRLDGKLVAIGVLDLLPQCVSAVYFMYHESVHDFGFGKLSAMREISLAKEMGYQWWYAGFYIHNCVKMKYKGEFRPSYILDPESYDWDLFDDGFKRKLDMTKYSSMSRDRRGEGEIIAARSTGNEDMEMSAANGEADLGSDDDIDEDEEDSVDHKLPVYMQSMPGVLTAEQLTNDTDLDNIKIEVHRITTEASNLVGWEKGDLSNAKSIKSILAGLVATMGAELANEVVMKLG